MNPASRNPKLSAIVLAVVVVAASFGYWFVVPKMPSETVSTTQQSLLVISSEQTRASSTSTSSTTLASGTTLWINVTATQQVSYYLRLLESNGTQPYVQLAKELRKLPDLKNATVVANIAYLALNATNPEVREAFELMIRGGTPSTTDFSYGVPRFNTELWGLYQLAEDNQLEKDDTTALAIAMVDGLFRTMGDDQVRSQVRTDDNAMLRFARETTEWQTSRGYYLLKNLPLEAKICWAWRGNTSPLRGPYSLQGQFQRVKLTLKAYQWNTVDPHTLKDMRSDAESRGWVSRDIKHFVASLEDYFWFTGQQQHWHYQTYPEIIKDIDGVDVTYGAVLNVEYQYYQRFTAGLKGLGDCQAETVFMDAWVKSIGQSSVITWRTTGNSPKPKDWLSHNHIMYFDPDGKKWTAYQLISYFGGRVTDSDPFDFWIYKPPVNQVHYLSESDFSLFKKGNGYYLFSKIPLGQIYRMLLDGIPSSDLKQWLLYS